MLSSRPTAGPSAGPTAGPSAGLTAGPPAGPPAGRGRGRPPRSEPERTAQRTRLLDGAMAAIRRAGPGASVDQMAVEAGVSKPVLYAEFGGKGGIV